MSRWDGVQPDGQPAELHANLDEMHHPIQADHSMRVAQLKPPLGLASGGEPEGPGGQLALHCCHGAWGSRRRLRGSGQEFGWLVRRPVDFGEGGFPTFHPAALSLVFLALALNHCGVEEARGEPGQPAMGGDGPAETGNRSAQVIGRTPAHANGGAGGAPNG